MTLGVFYIILFCVGIAHSPTKDYSVSQLSPTPPLTPPRLRGGVAQPGWGSSGVFHANENRYIIW
jgi:hypothetical protein